MPIKLVQPGDPQRRIEILKIPPDRMVQILCGPDEIVKVYLHMGLRESVPCLGDECKNCHLPSRQNAYAPVVEFFLSSGGGWKTRKAILSIPPMTFDLIERDSRREILKLSRKGNHKCGKLLWEVHKQVPPSDIAPFNVLRMMYARWGILGDRDDGPLPDHDDDQGVLPFPEVG